MKTFTVTIHHSCNYGAILQTYALQRSILGNGVENEVMEYPYNKGRYNKLSFKNPIYDLKILYSNIQKFIHKDKIEKREEAFALFRNNRLNLSRMYNSIEDLRTDPPKVDALITGSDQVWRFVEGEEFVEARFLDFGPDTVKRFSYAPSIESLNYTDEQKEYIKRILKGYKAVSVREQSAADYVQSFTGYEVSRVVDPVFLLEKKDWLKIAEPRKVKEPYILCYQVQSAPLMQRIVDELKKMTGYYTIAVIPYSIKWIKTDEALYDVSPEEFIHLIANAEIVVAASFHGAALGIEFDKVVYATARKNYCQRIKGIMELMGIDEYFIYEDSQIPVPKAYPKNKVEQKLREERKRSIAYLDQCLKTE